MESEALADEREADEDEEAECEDLDCGVLIDKVADGFCSEEHDEHGGDDGAHHNPDFFGHSDGGDDGVYGEDKVEYEELYDDLCEGGDLEVLAGIAFFTFELMVDLLGALIDEEESSCEQDEILAREVYIPSIYIDEGCF